MLVQHFLGKGSSFRSIEFWIIIDRETQSKDI